MYIHIVIKADVERDLESRDIFRYYNQSGTWNDLKMVILDLCAVFFDMIKDN